MVETYQPVFHRSKNNPTSRRSKNLWPASTLLGMPSFCKALSIERESALKRTLIASVEQSGVDLEDVHSRSTAKSPQRRTPPICATILLISTAMNVASACSDWKERNTGTMPMGWAVWSDFLMRALSIDINEQHLATFVVLNYLVQLSPDWHSRWKRSNDNFLQEKSVQCPWNLTCSLLMWSWYWALRLTFSHLGQIFDLGRAPSVY